MVLISTGDLGTLADTTVVLLSRCSRRQHRGARAAPRYRDEHHFHAPTVFPVLGGIVSVGLLVDTATDDASVVLRVGLLLLAGAALFAVTRLSVR